MNKNQFLSTSANFITKSVPLSAASVTNFLVFGPNPTFVGYRFARNPLGSRCRNDMVERHPQSRLSLFVYVLLRYYRFPVRNVIVRQPAQICGRLHSHCMENYTEKTRDGRSLKSANWRVGRRRRGQILIANIQKAG